MKKASLFSLLLLSACVTINIYFPAAAADKVADEIIKGIQSDEGATDSGLESKSKLPESNVNNAQIVFYNFLNLVIPVAHAETADLSVNTPEVRALRVAMHSRFAALKPYYSKGLLGIQRDGFLVARGSVPLKDRNKLNRLLNAENNDRKKLYQAIANSNGHPEWFEQIRATFATRWISNAKSKWWIQSPGGAWMKK